ncbi:hypothetical protein [uncultured Stenotrophomonas sp.]|uniref:hypothetical protein n=1 Tax=uncultured Stenotrophomonas sp. TaxID=165438 RepID=UPI0028D11580|nr:hypothetical protein [uncultured Stenotrophomonas sp.]
MVPKHLSSPCVGWTIPPQAIRIERPHGSPTVPARQHPATIYNASYGSPAITVDAAYLERLVGDAPLFRTPSQSSDQIANRPLRDLDQGVYARFASNHLDGRY